MLPGVALVWIDQVRLACTVSRSHVVLQDGVERLEAVYPGLQPERIRRDQTGTARRALINWPLTATLLFNWFCRFSSCVPTVSE